jgi:hypothetical protein
MSMESRFYTQAPLLARTALTRFEEAIDRQMATSQAISAGSIRDTNENHGRGHVSVALGPDISRDLKRIDVLVTLNNGEYAMDFGHTA